MTRTRSNGFPALRGLTLLALVAVGLSPYSPLAQAAPPPVSGCPDDEMLVIGALGDTVKGGAVAPLVAQKVTTDSALKIATLALTYPSDGPLEAGVAAGARAVQSRIAQITTGCPNMKFALIGHETGASVVSAAITGIPAAQVPPLDPTMVKFVDSVILIQDPGRVPGEPFNMGDAPAETTGPYPRQLGAFGSLAKKTQSYCLEEDVVCGAGTAATPGGAYSTAFTTAAAAFIVKEIEN